MSVHVVIAPSPDDAPEHGPAPSAAKARIHNAQREALEALDELREQRQENGE